MKKYAILFLFLPTVVFAASLPTRNSGNGLPETNSILHFSSWATTGTGTQYGPGPNLLCRHRWIIDFSVLPTNFNAKLEGKDDYGNWFVMDNYSTTTPDAQETRWVFNKCSNTFRVKIDTNDGTVSINSIHGGNQ
jgi:hypothetical protein